MDDIEEDYAKNKKLKRITKKTKKKSPLKNMTNKPKSYITDNCYIADDKKDQYFSGSIPDTNNDNPTLKEGVHDSSYGTTRPSAVCSWPEYLGKPSSGDGREDYQEEEESTKGYEQH